MPSSVSHIFLHVKELVFAKDKSIAMLELNKFAETKRAVKVLSRQFAEKTWVLRLSEKGILCSLSQSKFSQA